MNQITVTISTSNRQTKLLLTEGSDQLMKAILPPSHHARHPRAMQTFLEGLALLLGHSFRVVVSAADLEGTSLFGLTDDFGVSQPNVFYSVEVVEPTQRRGAKQTTGVGDFRDLRQLSLIGGTVR